eukprot:2103486-Pyramimonas_sp.AAC.1
MVVDTTPEAFNRTAFKIDVATQLSTRTNNVSPNSVQLIAVEAGSLIVTFEIQPPPGESTISTEVATTMKEDLSSPTFTLSAGPIIARTVSTPEEVRALTPSPPPPLGGGGDDDDTGIIIAIGASGVVFLAIIGVCVWKGSSKKVKPRDG